jgi:hypothetical protein
VATLTSPTLERLIKEVRISLRQPDSDNSTWSDAEITMYLNDAVRMYFLEVVKSSNGLFDTQSDLDITSGQETVAMPTDCFQVKTLYRKTGTYYEPLVYRNNLNESYDSAQSTGSMYTPYYYFRGNNFVLRPVPGFSETAGLRLEYTQFPETIIWGGDSMTSQVSPIFKELIIFYAIYKCKLTDDLVNAGQTSVPALTHLSSLYKNFQETCSPRTLYPQFVRPFNP